jgi:hypothetical protein
MSAVNAGSLATVKRRTIGRMADEPRPRVWTTEQEQREARAQRERVRRDAGRGVTRNLRDSVAHTEFAKRFADAFKHSRRT